MESVGPRGVPGNVTLAGCFLEGGNAVSGSCAHRTLFATPGTKTRRLVPALPIARPAHPREADAELGIPRLGPSSRAELEIEPVRDSCFFQGKNPQVFS